MRTGYDMGFSGVHTDLDAVARLGQLYLDDGVWEGRRLLPAGWVADASSVQIPNPQREEPDWQQGYGFQVWMSRHGYRGDGAFGQYMVVLPEHDAVVAMFSCTEVMQAVLDSMWSHLLPAMGSESRPPSPADATLDERLAGLALPTVLERRGGAAPHLAPGPSSHRTLSAIEVADGRMVIREGEGAIEVPLRVAWTAVEPSTAASAAQLADGRLAVDLALLSCPHRLEIELDPVSGTFATHWPILPLFGAGLEGRLASMASGAAD
jgi:hypothetical protein